MNALLPLLCVFCQDPIPPPARLDVVQLRNGDELVGRIRAEVEGYLELELEAGATVGLGRDSIAAIRRGAVGAPAVAAAVHPSDAWFVLYDARGTSVGWLHSAVVVGSDGSYTVSEEYEFADGRRRYQVTSLAIADAAGRARQSYFRERISEPVLPAGRLDGAAAGDADRVVDERIVEATRRDDQLVVLRLDSRGRRQRELPWDESCSFPLLARTQARQARRVVGPVTMFDPAEEQLVVRRFDGTRLRRIVHDGERIQVTEVAETTTGRTREWVDADLRIVRRELAGPSLVAVPSSAESARIAVGSTSIPAALAAEPGGAFGLWVPNPAWIAGTGLPAGHISLSCPAHDAQIRLSRLDHLEPDASVDAAADAVGRWLALLHPELRIEARTRSQLRDRTCVQLAAAGGARRATFDVAPHPSGFLVLSCIAPAEAWSELSGDFDFVRRTVEWEPEALSPPLQGPLRAPPAASDRRVPPAGERTAPTVRIPN